MPDLATALATPGVLGASVPAGSPDAVPLATGLAQLDRLLGGGLTGKVLLTGLPGRGRSVLASQFALAAAMAGRSVLMMTPREEGWTIACRFIAATSRAPLHRLLSGHPLDVQSRSRVIAAQERLAAVDLRYETAGLTGRPPADRDVIVLDDLHLQSAQAKLSWLPWWSRLLIATVPLDLVCDGPIGLAPRLNRAWVEPYDVVIAIDWSLEPREEGLAHLIVLRNRTGPCASIAVAFQGHFARFVDLGPGV